MAYKEWCKSKHSIPFQRDYHITRRYVPLCSQRIHCLSKQSVKGTISLKSSVLLLLLLGTRFTVYSSIVELYSLGAKVHYRTYKNKEICGGLTQRIQLFPTVIRGRVIGGEEREGFGHSGQQRQLIEPVVPLGARQMIAKSEN